MQIVYREVFFPFHHKKDQFFLYFGVYDTQNSGLSGEAQFSPSGQKLHYLLTINLKEGRNLAIKDRSGKHIIMWCSICRTVQHFMLIKPNSSQLLSVKTFPFIFSAFLPLVLCSYNDVLFLLALFVGFRLSQRWIISERIISAFFMFF